MRFAELGSSRQEEPESKAFRIVRNRLRMDFISRLNKLGNLHGDLRFYLSGAIQAMILSMIFGSSIKEIILIIFFGISCCLNCIYSGRSGQIKIRRDHEHV